MKSTNVRKEIRTKHHKLKVHIERYDSAMDVADDCKTRKITDKRFHDMTKREIGSWEGVNNYEEAISLLRDGYQPTVDSLKDAIRMSSYVEKRIKFMNDVHGFAPVVPLALNGVPNCMMNMRMKQIKTKVIDVYYDMTTNAGTTSETIIKNGQELLGAIIALEKSGYRFNLYACQTYTQDDSVDMLCVKVKSADKPIDLKRISFPLTHTAYFRVIGFDWYSKTPGGTYRMGYGTSIRSYLSGMDEVKEFSSQMFGNTALYITGKEIQNRNHEYIKEVLTNDKSES